jgi:hypothetical protein
MPVGESERTFLKRNVLVFVIFAAAAAAAA